MRLLTTDELKEGMYDKRARVWEKKPQTLGDLLEGFDLKLENFEDLNLSSKILLRRMDYVKNREVLTYALVIGDQAVYHLVPFKGKPGYAALKKMNF